ncbi:MAG: class I SAM-dependent methyltransferase [Actinomycetales bacterium]|nr:class I SAM-dependent methyltransferase [Actinomycetales bacterium]
MRLNRAHWDGRAAQHALGYGSHRYVDDPELLSGVVRYDLPRLGDIRGLDAVHLQCHIGTDTLSLHRLGARVTGLDFSPASLAEARRLAEAAGAPIRYVESDVYRASVALEPASFDLVYTGIGVLGWLPRVAPWAEQIAALLRPGGRLVFREGHPLMWTLDETRPDALVARYGYFEHEEPLVFIGSDTYVEIPGELPESTTHEWNHGIAEVLGALLAAGLDIAAVEEHDAVPWDALPGHLELGDDEEYRMRAGEPRLPLTWSVVAVKR